ncbi:hypothetical protein GCM10007925_18700 [Sphingomonas astaxanthinifaciens DSM 22298]|jgi:hypothetical protein|uniref:Uncharacterized protein n=1 Tax=Sphingomonas astaxanthinifaciens DSM 22298 TaxID=1123267 RepID=A0ABQ5ZC21_9SPHN|nr:hypothetical protein GCM10007925_18700 [Sphingomonas astaxanthinifaciens DSM 22298]
MAQAAQEPGGVNRAEALRAALLHAREALRILDEADSHSMAALRCQWLVDEILSQLER